ncbi:Fe-S cluster assembly protein SufB [Acidiplasma sp.]|uniref:Fe-S cluster assembly protein SufB n=1 Tax=Acidiplasma sp. TaxID=1872114 RepID=UPI0031643763
MEDYNKDEEIEKLTESLKHSKKSDYEFYDKINPVYSTGKGLNRKVVEEISDIKKEPDWMRRSRLKALEIFLSKPMPTWGPDLSEINFDEITYYTKPEDVKAKSWDEVPDQIKETFNKLGIPQMEQKYLAGSVAQYDSEGVYSSLKKEWEEKGVIFTDLDTAVQQYPDLVREYYCKAIPPSDNKFAALNGAVWSGGSFLYVPKNVTIDLPLQTYFRLNGEQSGQFEHTIVIADEGAKVHYIEGCLPEDELISQGDKFIAINQLFTNDGVISNTGNKRKITRKYVHPYNGFMYNIVPASPVNTFRATSEHPVLSIKREEVSVRINNGHYEISTEKLMAVEPQYRRADELNPGDFLVYVSPLEVQDNDSINESMLRILGFYTASGVISFNRHLNMYQMLFSFRENENASELYSIIKNMGEQASIIKSNKKYTVSTYSKPLIEFCIHNAGQNSNEKIFSETVMKLPPEKQKIIIDSYAKVRGNLYSRSCGSRNVRISVHSKILALQIQEILSRSNIFAIINLRNKHYTIEYTENAKFHRIRHKNNYYFVPIKKIERQEYNDIVYNLEVDSDNSYLVKGFAVHNCTAPRYDTSSLHTAIVEIYAHKNSNVKYTSVQNWSDSVYNLPIKRAWVDEGAHMDWVTGELGSKVTMIYPSSYLRGRGASTSNLQITLATKGTFKDAGGKAIHLAPDTTSRIVSKSISLDDGLTVYRGLVRMNEGAKRAKSHVQCDALLINSDSKNYTYPYDEIYEPTAEFSHEATVGKIGTDELTYLRSRGLSEDEASSMIVLGFMDDIMKEIPMEFAVEMNRLVKLEMSKMGAVG